MQSGDTDQEQTSWWYDIKVERTPLIDGDVSEHSDELRIKLWVK